MVCLTRVLLFVHSCLLMISAQILYQCNFDTFSIGDSCLVREGFLGMLVIDKIGNIGEKPPIAPLSDVTSSLKPTENGENCSLPYEISPYKWDMYFCNNGYCPTQNNPSSKCQSGKFGHYNLPAPGSSITFYLNIDSSGINGTGHQCLTYFYYLPNINNTKQNIKVRVQESGGDSELIDNIIDSPYNGWIERRISFETKKTGYNIYFDLIKLSGVASPPSIVAFDEISIRLGSCFDQPESITTIPPITTPVITSKSITTTTTEEETTITTTVTVTSTIQTTTIELTTISTLTTTMPLTTITTTMSTTSTSTSTTISTTVTTTSMTTQTSKSTIRTVTTIPPTTTSTTTISSEQITTIQQMTSTTTMITNTTSKLTTFTSENLMEQKASNGSSKKTLIIILACTIPAGLLVIIGLSVWIKKTGAGGLLHGISEPFTDLSDQREMIPLEPEYKEDHYF